MIAMGHELLVGLILLGGLSTSGAGTPPGEARPNIVLIMTDDQGYGDLGVHGNPVLETPRLDRLAAESARAGTFYVHPVCTPTRAALMTGRHPQRSTAIDTYIGRAMLDPSAVTIAERLSDAGYSTGIFGKWHLGDCAPMRAIDQGFDVSVIHAGGGIGQPSDPPGGESAYTDPILFRNGVPESFEGYCTEVYVDEAIRFIDQVEKPFFLTLTTNAPHGPFGDVPEDLYDKYRAMDLEPVGASNHDRQARIFAMDSDIDRQVGRLLDHIEESGLVEDTVVIYLHDNGPDHDGYVAGLRGRKGSVHEGGVRSPLFVRWPRRIEPGDRPELMGAHLDLHPTILELCGVAPNPELPVDGISLVPALVDPAVSTTDRSIVIQAHRGDRPVRWHHAMVRDGRWKLVNHSGFGREIPEGEAVPMNLALYDLREDPAETRNLAAERPEEFKRLSEIYQQWWDSTIVEESDAYRPPAIRIGPEVGTVRLTRQDWRRTRKGPWGGRSQGRWWVESLPGAPHDVLVRKLPSATVRPDEFEIRFNGKVLHAAEWPKGESMVVVDAIELPVGTGWFEVVCRDEESDYGPYQVEVRPPS
ncbi:MAG: arylsulfatase [Planctomycetaceae bacterium]|nr:arylsulfatase [Planctomycetaceae bacterium]